VTAFIAYCTVPCSLILFFFLHVTGIKACCAMHAQVPDIARDYWKLGDKATMRDLLLSVRADEACHSHVNHTFAELDEDEKNPFAVGTHVVPTA